MGLAVSYGTNAVDENWDAGGSTTVEKRTADIAEAFADPKVKAVFTMIGGNNSNQLLDFVDYRLIAENPKIFCGFSDYYRAFKCRLRQNRTRHLFRPALQFTRDA